MTQSDERIKQGHDFRSVKNLLAAIETGRLRIPTAQEENNSLKQQGSTAGPPQNISGPLTDYRLMSLKRTSATALPTIDVLRAVQDKTIASETAYEYLQSSGGQPEISPAQLNKSIIAATEQSLSKVHKVVPAIEMNIINQFKKAGYAPEIRGHRDTPQQTRDQIFSSNSLNSFRERQLKDLEQRAKLTMAMHAKSHGFQGAPTANSELADTFKTIESFATQQIDKMQRMGVPADKIRASVLGSIQDAAINMPKDGEMNKLFDELKTRVNTNIEKQLGSRMDLQRSGLRMS